MFDYDDANDSLLSMVRTFYLEEFKLVSEYILNHLAGEENTFPLKPLKYFEENNKYNEMLLKQFDLSDGVKGELEDYKTLVDNLNNCIKNDNCSAKEILKTFFEDQPDRIRIILFHQNSELNNAYNEYIK